MYNSILKRGRLNFKGDFFDENLSKRFLYIRLFINFTPPRICFINSHVFCVNF